MQIRIGGRAGFASGFTRVLDGEAEVVGRRLLETLEHSEAWLAYVALYGPRRSPGPVWIDVDGEPATRVEYGRDLAERGS